jgi:hypothetical protein
VTVVRAAAVSCAVWLFAALPTVAEACAVCASGQEEQSTAAFRYSTALLSLLPLALIGGAVLWFRRRMRQLELHGPVGPARVPASR